MLQQTLLWIALIDRRLIQIILESVCCACVLFWYYMWEHMSHQTAVVHNGHVQVR